ncbi:MAG: substrate-binding domain-containing protein [Firmicutes bacterium]|nr:substrate-binding domain-containing protein [Bacillota bacterium]
MRSFRAIKITGSTPVKKREKTSLSSFLIILAIIACGLFLISPAIHAKEPVTITMATTTSLQDTGFLDSILPIFEKKYNVRVKVIAVGTGQSLALAKKGDADVVFVHAPKLEEEFVKEGFGVGRKTVMYNEFLIIGPSGDPAQVKGMSNVKNIFKKIAESKSPFVSRGDKSGTNIRELEIWKAVSITPEPPWYIESGSGMGQTLMITDQKQAYTLSDNSTYIAFKKKIRLVVMNKPGDPLLKNFYSVIAVNPEKFPHVHYKEAKEFIEFISSNKGANLIKDYGKEKFGAPIFNLYK